MKVQIYDVAIIGGGASGVVSACIVSNKLKTIILEKNLKLGRKILSSGAGKCNLSNSNISIDFYKTSEPEILKKIFQKIPYQTIIDFLNSEIGIMTKILDNGKIYPFSERAESVIFAFESYLKQKNVDIKTLTYVEDVEYQDEVFKITAKTLPLQWEKKNLSSQKLTFFAKNLILSTGGPSYPRIGGTDFGFKIAKKFGHSIKEPLPILVPLSVGSPRLLELSGVRITAGCIFNFKAKKIFLKDELLFTDYGISGPIAIDISFYMDDYIDQISFDLAPSIDKEEIFNFMRNRIEKNSFSIAELFFPVFEPKLINFICQKLKLDKNLKANEKIIKKIIDEIKNFKVYGIKKLSFESAMSKIGGVPLSEVDLNFESKKQKKLFLTGEILDCGGKSGGYNFHFAFTTAYSAAMKILENSHPLGIKD
ncbi:MAG: aminoacetone oxidase family FAD-binding enzyme [Elusimicrobiota bacterium]